MRAALLRAGTRGWGGGLRFPCAETTGAALTGTHTAVPGSATSGTGWTWVGGSSNEVHITGANASVTGLAIAGGILSQANGVTVTNCTAAGNITVSGASAGTTLSNLQVTNSGVSAACVTIAAGTSSTTVSRCTLSGQNGGAGRVAYGVQDSSGDPGTIVEDCHIYWFRVGGQAIAGVWQRNYIHDPGFLAADHTDGIDVEGTAGGPLAIRGNTILVALSQTSPLHQNATSSAITDLTVDGNLLAGGDYAIYGGNAGADAGGNHSIVIENNWISTMFYADGGVFGYGTSWNASGTGNAWTNNRWLDGPSAGQVIAHP